MTARVLTFETLSVAVTISIIGAVWAELFLLYRICSQSPKPQQFLDGIGIVLILNYFRGSCDNFDEEMEYLAVYSQVYMFLCHSFKSLKQ